MKKIISFIFILFIFITSFTSVRAASNVVNINFYALNDFHGALLESSNGAGISKIGKYLIDEKSNNPESTIILSSGDMFQGTAVSSMSRGRAVVDCMNAIGFDSMTIGNHEFDWGVQDIEKFLDGNVENGEAKFPFIGANIIDRSTNELASFATPYVIIERSGLKIGILGIIDDSCMNEIMASVVAPYLFDSPLQTIEKYVPILRNTEKCDIVVVSAHAGEATTDISDIKTSLAYQTSLLSGDSKVDAVFNGHSHYRYAGIFNNNGYDMAYIQSGANGQNIGKITIEYDKTAKKATTSYASNIYTNSNCKKESSEINGILSNYQEYIDKANGILGTAKYQVNRENGAIWAASVIKYATNSDVGIVNYGGIRSNAFPLKDNVSYGDIFELTPFENMIVTVELTGAQINKMTTNMNTNNLYFSKNDTSFQSDKVYKVATIDYLFEKTNYPFQKGNNIDKTNVVFRDCLADEIENSQKNYGQWDYNKIYSAGSNDTNNNTNTEVFNCTNFSIIKLIFSSIFVSLTLFIIKKGFNALFF